MSNGLRERADAVAQVIVNDLDNPHLSDDDFHHVHKVLRARPGERIVVTDGVGHWRLCQWNDGVEAVGDINYEERLEPKITVGFALTKGHKPELVVQKLTELGVDVIRPLIATYTVVKWDSEKSAANVERFRRVAYEAAMQCRRVWSPEITDVVTYEDLPLGERIIAEVGGPPLSADCTTLLIGPEGGWSSEELAGANASFDLGPTILRAETAALVAATKLTDMRWNQTFRP